MEATRSARAVRLDEVLPRIQEGADVAIFDGAAEKVATLGDDARVEDRAESRGQHGANGLRQSHLVRREDPSPGTAG